MLLNCPFNCPLLLKGQDLFSPGCWQPCLEWCIWYSPVSSLCSRVLFKSPVQSTGKVAVTNYNSSLNVSVFKELAPGFLKPHSSRGEWLLKEKREAKGVRTMTFSRKGSWPLPPQQKWGELLPSSYVEVGKGKLLLIVCCLENPSGLS